MSNKRPLVLWSGGADSTYVLACYLSDNIDCDVVYVKHPNNKEKTKRELKARKKLSKIFRKQYIGRIMTDTIMEGYVPKPYNDFRYSQFLTWMCAVMGCYDANKHSKVVISYLGTDQISAYRDDIHRAWDSMSRICKIDPIPIELPVSEAMKMDIIKHYVEEDGAFKKLYKHITFCESQEKEDHCGKCVPCKTHRIVSGILKE